MEEEKKEQEQAPVEENAPVENNIEENKQPEMNEGPDIPSGPEEQNIETNEPQAEDISKSEDTSEVDEEIKKVDEELEKADKEIEQIDEEIANDETEEKKEEAPAEEPKEEVKQEEPVEEVKEETPEPKVTPEEPKQEEPVEEVKEEAPVEEKKEKPKEEVSDVDETQALIEELKEDEPQEEPPKEEEKPTEESKEEGSEEITTHIYGLRTTANREDQVMDFLTSNAEKKKFNVHSVIRAHGMRGYIFVEADSKSDAEQAAFGVPYARGILPKEIDYHEIEHMLEQVKREVNIQQNDIVEIISGPFKRENAKIMRIDKGKEEVVVELLEAAVPIPITLKLDAVKVIRRDTDDSSEDSE